jgi:hypothetical protein
MVRALGVLLALVVGGGDALAVVGRPLTPISYAGVARRTSRRTARRNAYYYNYIVPAAPQPTTNVRSKP